MSSTVPHVTPPHLRDRSTDPLILVVDDDPGVRDLTGSMLELKGYAVI
jgi:DNA-binding NtrC family response regulator